MADDNSYHPSKGVKKAGVTRESLMKRLSRAAPDLRAELSNLKLRKSLLKKRRQRSMSDLWTVFENQSTFHGICHASTAPSRRWRAMWYIAFTICLLLLIYQTSNIVTRYFRYGKNVDLDLKFKNSPFPSVTVCNLNPYKVSAISQIKSIRDTMNAFSKAVGGKQLPSDGNNRTKRRAKRLTKDDKNAQNDRRFHAIYSPCLCSMNMLTGARLPGGCLPAHKGAVVANFEGYSKMVKKMTAKCLCDFDTWSKTLWPCFPVASWQHEHCRQCTVNLGHCPMIFDKYPSEMQTADRCLCHRDYNHCISNDNGHISDISDVDDLSTFEPGDRIFGTIEKLTTTAKPEAKEALGFEELTDEIAIANQGRKNLIFSVGSLPQKNKTNLSYKLEEFILKCSFNQHDCDFNNDFKLHYDESYGNCFIFNWNRSSNIVSNRAGANYGLRLLLYANISEYLPTSPSVGVRVTVHDKWQVPFPDAFGYSAPTGFLTSFGVKTKQFQRLPSPYGRCKEGHETHPDYIYTGFNYSVEGCHRSCTQKEIIRVCGCADPMYPILGNVQTCQVTDPVGRSCIKNATLYMAELIGQGKLHDCQCYQPCWEVAYNMAFSASRWPSGTAKLMECSVGDYLCLEKYRQNAAMLQIFYEELNYEKMTETPAYTFVSAIADFGGLTGLWIGASMVSMLELIVLGYFMSKTWYGKKQEKKLTQEMTPPVWFTGDKKPNFPSPSIFKMPIKLVGSRKLLTSSSIVDQEVIKRKKSLTPSSLVSRKTTVYISPSQELPCQCQLNDMDQIELMSAVCPEHGYLVRRNTMSNKPEIDENEEEEEEEEEDDENVEKEDEQELEEDDEIIDSFPQSQQPALHYHDFYSTNLMYN